MDFLIWGIIGVLILPWIIYFSVKAAVKEGTFEALIEYEEHKKQEQ